MRRFVGRKLLLPGGVGDNEHIFLAALAVDIISAAVEHGGLLPVLSFQCRDKLCEFLRNSILIRDMPKSAALNIFRVVLQKFTANESIYQIARLRSKTERRKSVLFSENAL